MIQFKHKQQGSTTIIVAVATLMLITMVTVMNANISVMGAKTSSNEYRTLQALLSAQAGIDFSLTNLSKGDLADIAETELTYNEGGTAVTTGFYSVDVDATDPDLLIITSTGLSADRAANKQLIQRLIFSTVLRNDATKILAAPLITSGDTSINHSNITFGDASARVWSGGIIATSSQGTLAGNGSDILALRKLGSRLYENDPLATTAFNGLFSTQMRADQNQGIKHLSIYHDCSSAACSNPTKMTSASGFSKLHYVQGGLILDDITVGTQTNPIFIIVDLSDGGTVSLTQNAVINGIIVVLGDMNNGGNNASINGAMIVDGILAGGTGLTLNFDMSVFNSMSSVGVYTRLPGSWTDR